MSYSSTKRTQINKRQGQPRAAVQAKSTGGSLERTELGGGGFPSDFKLSLRGSKEDRGSGVQGSQDIKKPK